MFCLSSDKRPEQSIAAARASVMVYDDLNKKWVPAGSSHGLSKVTIVLVVMMVVMVVMAMVTMMLVYECTHQEISYKSPNHVLCTLTIIHYLSHSCEYI